MNKHTQVGTPDYEHVATHRASYRFINGIARILSGTPVMVLDEHGENMAVAFVESHLGTSAGPHYGELYSTVPSVGYPGSLVGIVRDLNYETADGLPMVQFEAMGQKTVTPLADFEV